MPVSDFAPQLSFLKDSAHSLHSLSPSTAAYLLSAHNQILHSQLKPLHQRQQDTFCGACGNLRSAEWTETIHIKKDTGSRVSKKAPGAGATTTIYKCLRCHRRLVKLVRKETVRTNLPQTTTDTRSTPDIQPSASTQSAASPALGQSGSEVASKTTDNASSKKRAKTRKGGLQALLASKQQNQSNQPSLDLFDFLQ